MSERNLPYACLIVDSCHERLQEQFPKGHRIFISQERFLIGRAPECGLSINDEEARISRVHLCIVTRPDGYFLFDNESANGTWLNGDKITPNETYRVAHGARIGIAGSVDFIFDDPNRTRRFDAVNPYLVSGFSINNVTRQVIIRHRTMENPLAEVDFDFLAYLYRNSHRPVPKEELAQEVWRSHYDAAFDTVISSAAYRVRQRLKEADPKAHDYIKSLRGVGYQLKLPDS